MRVEPKREDLGVDLLLVPHYAADDFTTVDLTTVPRQPAYLDETVDLDIAAGRDCLRQALVLRLLTPKGSLRDLGHASYGSRLHELIGEPNTPDNRLRARSFVLQALSEERRVAEVLELDVRPHAAVSDRILIGLSVRPVAPGIVDSLAVAIEIDL